LLLQERFISLYSLTESYAYAGDDMEQPKHPFGRPAAGGSCLVRSANACMSAGHCPDRKKVTISFPFYLLLTNLKRNKESTK
jgi:hypothetical protein